MAGWRFWVDADAALEAVSAEAARNVAARAGDELVVIPGVLVADGRLKDISQTDDGVTCAAAIDVLRWLDADYQAQEG